MTGGTLETREQGNWARSSRSKENQTEKEVSRCILLFNFIFKSDQVAEIGRKRSLTFLRPVN